MLEYGIKKNKCNGFFSSFHLTVFFYFIIIIINLFLLLDLQQNIPQFFILLNEKKNNMNEAIDGKPIMHFLVSKSDEPEIGTDLIKTILNLGADVNAVDNSGSSALYVLSSNCIGEQNVQFLIILQFLKIFLRHKCDNKNHMHCLEVLI